MSKGKAKRILDRLEGTLIADLKSLKIIAEERSKSDSLKEKLPGAFNFSLFITGLIACETLGFFINKTAEDGRSEDNIKYFISSNYFKQCAFKKDRYLNILVSLRTNLVHVFGMTDLRLENIDTDIGLSVGGSNEPELLREHDIVKLNGVKFLEFVIDGFDSIKSEVTSGNDNSALIGAISRKSMI
ncbi:MAG: hypothetical protein FP815_02990 [Desulfobulbaceae bacterium]|nr:hypothetical protein [Desulfobulbaceae bacterium]